MEIAVLILAVLPVAILLWYVYKKDKFEKEPVGMLARAFLGGILSIPLTLILVGVFRNIYLSESIFYSSFVEAGIPEELAKFLIFMFLIWRNKNFDEYFDGIVYAVFIGMGFACVENVMYLFDNETINDAFHLGLIRGILSVPAHFLFAVIMGYYLSLAKFKKENKSKYLTLSLLLPILAHGLFDFLLMFVDYLNSIDLTIIGGLLYFLFLYLDIKLWKIGLKHINKLTEESQIDRNNKIFEEIFKNKNYK